MCLSVKSSVLYFPTPPSCKEFPRNWPRNVVPVTEKYITMLFWSLKGTNTHKILQVIKENFLTCKQKKVGVFQWKKITWEFEMWKFENWSCMKNTIWHLFKNYSAAPPKFIVAIYCSFYNTIFYYSICGLLVSHA